MKPSVLGPWERLVLLALVISPAHGGLALVMVLLLTLGLGVRFALRRDPAELSWDWLVAAPLLCYFVYFYANGAILGQSVEATFASMKGNLPLVLLGLCALFMPKPTGRVGADHVGFFARRAVLLTGVAALAVYSIAQWAPGWGQGIVEEAWSGGVGGRLQMYSRNPLMFASMYLAVSFLSLLGWRDMPPFERSVALAALATGLLVIMFWAQARGAMLVAVPLTVLALWYVRPNPVRLLVPMFAVAMAAGLAYGLDEGLRNKVDSDVGRLWVGLESLSASGVNEDASVSIRLNMYRFGLEAAAESPWWGHGYQNRFEVVRSSMPGVEAGHLHNGFLNHLVAGGIPGLVLFCWVLVLPLLLIRRAQSVSSDMRYGATTGFIVMAGTACSTEVLGHYVHSTFYGLLFLLLSLMLPRGELASAKKNPALRAF